MPINEPNQPLTELCERAWKLLHRHGAKSTDRSRPAYGSRSVDHVDHMQYRLGDWFIKSENRILWIFKKAPGLGARTSVFSVDEDGCIGAIDVIECANALEAFRQATILDDLSEVRESC